MHIVQRLTLKRVCQIEFAYSTGFIPLLRAAPGPPIAPETAAPTAPVETEMLLRKSHCTIGDKLLMDLSILYAPLLPCWAIVGQSGDWTN